MLALSVLVGCGSCSTDPRPLDRDNDHVQVEIGRLDTLLFHTNGDLASTSRQAYARFGQFYQVYIEDILQLAPVNDPRLVVPLSQFVNDPDWQDAQAAIEKNLGDMEAQRAQFEDAFSRIHQVFPDSVAPRVVGYNSGFNFGVFPTDSVLGIGLEWFIGPEERVVEALAPERFPQYFKQRMRPELLVPSALKGWMLVHYLPDLRTADLLTNMVELGKVMVLLEAVLPGTNAELLFAYSPEQLAWCTENEVNIWHEIVAQDLLYSKSEKEIGRFLNEGPFTPGFPRESPGRLAEWLGYRMVKSFLEDRADVGYAELFRMHDARLVLKSYKPH